MVSTILKRSIAFSITAWLLVAVGVGDYSLHNFGRADNYIIAGIIIAPFALTLIMGAIHCLPKKSDYLEKESVPYILFKYSFQRNFDSDCCLAFYFLAFIFALRLDSKFITYGTVYIIACFLATMSDSGDYDSDAPDAIESERISKLKVFFLSLALTPIAGYIAVRMYKSEQNKKTEIMKRHLERAKAYLEAKDYTNAILECKEGLNGADYFEKLDEGNFDQREVRYDILHVLAEIYCEQGKYSEAINSYHQALFVFPHNIIKAQLCVYPIVHKEWVDEIAVTHDALRVLEACEDLFPNEECFTKERTRLTQNQAALDEALSYVKHAKAYLEQMDYANAIADCTKAIELAPKGDKCYFYFKRAEVYFEQEDYANAITDYTKAIGGVPKSLGNGGSFSKANLYGNRADVYLAQKDYANAIADYTKAIGALDSDEMEEQAEMFKKRGEAYQKLGDMEQAEADFAKAKELEEKQENE